jgi:uncharacterized protein (TIGR03000 family)
MFTRFIVLSALGCLIVPAVASAQFPWSRQGEYLYREDAQRRGDGRSYQPPVVVVNPAPAVESSRAFYPAPQDFVAIDVTGPADAKIMFDGKATMQTGAHRQFFSPSLVAGSYRYEVHATWLENGKEISQRRTVPVQPGDVVRIDITRDGIHVKR